MHADAKQTEFRTSLSGILLGGLSLNAAFGLWSVAPVEGLVMVPIIAKEGIEGFAGKACDDCSARSCEATPSQCDTFVSWRTILKRRRS